MNVTREGIEVMPGQVWRDLDHRMQGRTITIIRVAEGFAYYGSGNSRRISIKRMHRHSTGFELVFQPDTGEQAVDYRERKE